MLIDQCDKTRSTTTASTYNSPSPHRKRDDDQPQARTKLSRVDLLETFAGTANVSKLAFKWGFKTLMPVDYNTGFDLADKTCQKQIQGAIDLHRPLLLLNEIDCRPWTLLQDNINRPDQLAALRAKVRPMFEKIVKWCEQQDREGRFWLIENPEQSRLWDEPSLRRLLQRSTTLCTTSRS